MARPIPSIHRRLGRTTPHRLTQLPAFVNKINGAVNTEEGVRRVIYSSQAYDANAKGVEGGIKLLDEENSSKFGISGDKGGTHLWWDNADKRNF